MKKLIIIISLVNFISLGFINLGWSADLKKGLSAFRSGNFVTAFGEWKPLADKGDPTAQNSLGIMYYYGFGIPIEDSVQVVIQIVSELDYSFT